MNDSSSRTLLQLSTQLAAKVLDELPVSLYFQLVILNEALMSPERAFVGPTMRKLPLSLANHPKKVFTETITDFSPLIETAVETSFYNFTLFQGLSSYSFDSTAR